jgi:GNAT superfamily N-acetyltransferase
MIVRKATQADVPQLVLLWKQFMKENDAIIIASDKRSKPILKRKANAQSIFKKTVTRQIKSPDSFVQVAEHKKKIFAYSIASMQKASPIKHMKKFGYIGDLFVAKNHRSVGIASLFRESMLTWFRKKGVVYVSVHVSPRNTKAYKIYKKWGFHEYNMDMWRKI